MTHARFRDADGLLSAQTVRVTRSTSLRFAPSTGYGSLRETDLSSLPQFEYRHPYRHNALPMRYAVTGAYVEHTWSGSSWHTSRKMTGVKLTKAGEPWGGYPREVGIEFGQNRDALPEEVRQFFDGEPTPLTTIVVTEVP